MTIRELRCQGRLLSSTALRESALIPPLCSPTPVVRQPLRSSLGAVAGRYQLSAVTPGKSKAATLAVVETALDYQQSLGSILADQYCNRCHDSESSARARFKLRQSRGQTHAFSDGSTLNKMSDADLASIILHGGPALNRSALMPPYGNTLSASDVRALISYTRAVADPPYEPAGTVYARK